METFIRENFLIILPLAIWTISWKGVALWKAAKNDSKPWFIALLLINTLGILEILYVFVLSSTPPQSAFPPDPADDDHTLSNNI